MIKCSLVVPTYNGRNRIINLLESLQQQTVFPDEVIVVVDGSSDDTIKEIEKRNFNKFPLILHAQVNKGRPSARNAGLKLAKYDLILSFDDDMVLTPNVVEQHIKHHIKHPYSVCVGFQAERKPLRSDDPNYAFLDFRYYLSQKWNKKAVRYPQAMSRCNYQLTTANCSFPKKIIEVVGYFDENLKEVEDFDLATRIIRKGIQMYYYSDIVAWHNNSDWDFTKFIARQVQYRKDDITWLKKIEAQGKIDEDFKTHPRYTIDKQYPFFKGKILRIFAQRFWIKLTEEKYFILLPKGFRYKFMDIVNTAFTSTLKDPNN